MLVMMVSLTSISQIMVAKPHCDTVVESKCCKPKNDNPFIPYIGFGLSLSKGNNFTQNTYASTEVGVSKQNFGMALVLGRGSLSGFNSDNIRNYFYEAKVMGYVPMGTLNTSIIFGYGGYFDTPNMFIEYGVGMSYTKGKITYGVLYSNWDGVDYITPNISYSF